MMIEHRQMKFWAAVAVAGLLLASCSKANPRSCRDGTCTDPAFPFCDTDGAIDGAAQTCITVDCTPGEFAGCRGDTAITCNDAGADYDLIQCQRGCDDAAGGCHLCDPNQTACTNGKVATCDASGKIVSSETCALGCFEDQPRCRAIVPSNNLGAYLDMVPDPPDLELSSATFRTDDGSVTAGGQAVTVPSFAVPGTGTGSTIRVFVVNSLKLHSATIQNTSSPQALPGAAMAIVARRDLIIDGEVLVNVRVGGAYLGCNAAMASIVQETSTRVLAYGGGGGGNGTGGGHGGNIGPPPGLAGDSISGTSILVPLRGGCTGGYELPLGNYPTGGGALQLSSGTLVSIDASIDLKGGQGQYDFDASGAYVVGGGGAGGSLLIDAPTVRLGTNARVLATGGTGFAACTTPSTYCGVGGAGATATTVAQDGMSITYSSGSNLTFQSGGGGGGLGRLRINTADGQYTKTSSTVEDAVVSTGTIQTR